MLTNLVSTQEFAKMMHVTETTIKRWADSGKIPCTKTLGRHRKFHMKDVIAFAEKNGYVIAGIQALQIDGGERDKLEFAMFTHNYSMLADIVFTEVLKADRKGLLELVRYFYRNHIHFPTLVDEIIRPVMIRIGDLWKQGTLEIHQEHLVSQALNDTLSSLQHELYHKSPHGLKAVCACPEGELHELGLKCIAGSLECDGWEVLFLGANTPMKTLLSFVNLTKPNLVCLSIAGKHTAKNLKYDIHEVVKRLHQYGGKLMIGGYKADELTEEDVSFDHIASSSEDAVEFARTAFNLKPGPKRKT